MAIDLESLGLTEMIRLRERLADALARRYERTLALAITDATGGAAPRALALAAEVGAAAQPTAAGGVLTSFAAVDDASAALVELHRRASAEGLLVRTGLHYAPVLTNGKLFSGDALRVAGLLAASAAAGELRLSRQAYVELSSRFRLRCRALPPLADAARAIEALALHWQDRSTLPVVVRVEETGALLPLPDQPVTTFGRLPDNDVVLSLPDRAALQRISRLRHFELVRELDELYFRPLSEQPALVDGQPVPPGDRARVVPGTVVRLAGIMTLTFQSAGGEHVADDGQLQTMAVSRPFKDR